MYRGDPRDTMLDGDSWRSLQQAVARFRTALTRGDEPAIEEFLPPDGRHRTTYVAELVHEELEHRLRAGESVAIASYLGRFEELGSDSLIVRELEDVISQWSPAQSGADVKGQPRLVGRYELGEMIGTGAFGVVHRAYDPILKRPVAIKRPRPGAIETPEAIERFFREARAIAALQHPNIVVAHDVGQADGEVYLVSNLIEGRNLADEMAEGRPGFLRSAEWVAAVADALEHAHSRGLIHRDVKPSNVLIDSAGHVYLTDFGLAKGDGGEATLTVEGQVIGTPAYMSPEQAEGGKKPVDARADVYSLGAFLYELLTGSRPFGGAGAMLLGRIREEEPRPPRRLDESVPRDLETICLKAMAKEPRHRYADAAGFAADIRRWLRGEPVLARSVGRIGMAWRRCRRKPILSGLVGSLVLSVLFGCVGVAWQWRRAESQRRLAEGNLDAARQQRQRAVQALRDGSETLSALVQIYHEGTKVPADPDRDRIALQRVILGYYRNSLRDQLSGDPDLHHALVSLTMEVTGLIHHNAPLEVALNAWEETQGIVEGLLRDDPNNLVYLDDLARCLWYEGGLLVAMGRVVEGAARLRQSLERWQAYGALTKGRSTADRGHRLALEAWSGAEVGLASAEMLLGRKSEAFSHHNRAVSLVREICEEEPGNWIARRRLAHVYATAIVWGRDELADEAISRCRLACEIIEPIASELPSDRGVQEERAFYLFQLANMEDRVEPEGRSARSFPSRRRDLRGSRPVRAPCQGAPRLNGGRPSHHGPLAGRYGPAFRGGGAFSQGLRDPRTDRSREAGRSPLAERLRRVVVSPWRRIAGPGAARRGGRFAPEMPDPSAPGKCSRAGRVEASPIPRRAVAASLLAPHGPTATGRGRRDDPRANGTPACRPCSSSGIGGRAGRGGDREAPGRGGIGAGAAQVLLLSTVTAATFDSTRVHSPALSVRSYWR